MVSGGLTLQLGQLQGGRSTPRNQSSSLLDYFVGVLLGQVVLENAAISGNADFRSRAKCSTTFVPQPE